MRQAARGGQADRLTRRELDVVQLVASGLTNREIAVRLGISSRTVANHLQSIARKLGWPGMDHYVVP